MADSGCHPCLRTLSLGGLVIRFNERLRLVVWAGVGILAVQCLFVWLALRSQRARLREEYEGLRDRLESSYAVGCSNAVQRLLSALPSMNPSPAESRDANASYAPRPRLLGVGSNGYYDYVDFSVTDEYGIESSRRVYRRSSRPDPRAPRDRRPPGY